MTTEEYLKQKGHSEIEAAQLSHKAEAQIAAIAPNNEKALAESLRWFMDALESGALVRDISKDARPEWAFEMMKFVIQLNKAKAALIYYDTH